MLIASPFGIVSIQLASGQASQVNSDMNNDNNNNANSLNLQDIPSKKVHAGDIDIAYKIFGMVRHLLIGGSGLWILGIPSILRNLSSNHTVIIFDNRGVGNTTAGTKPFSMINLQMIRLVC